jgi:hypothetical protein
MNKFLEISGSHGDEFFFKMTVFCGVAPCSPVNFTDVSEALTASNTKNYPEGGGSKHI